LAKITSDFFDTAAAFAAAKSAVFRRLPRPLAIPGRAEPPFPGGGSGIATAPLAWGRMNDKKERFLSRPLYEALPWIYILCASRARGELFPSAPRHQPGARAPGLAGVLFGAVVALRRRDYRQMKANNYLNPDSSELPRKTIEV